MKLICYRTRDAEPEPGATRIGVVVDDAIIDGTAALDEKFHSIRDLLAADGLPVLKAAISGRTPAHSLGDVKLLPPVPEPAKILCVGMNYKAHREETRRPPTAHPTLFTRFADSQINHGAPALKPAVSDMFDYEGELAVIIGRPASAVSEKDAMDHVAGYACYNDFSVRDWQRHTSQFLPGKNFPGTGAFGPWMVTADEVDDIKACRLQTRVNDEVRQAAPISDLLFSIDQLISYISTFTPLAAGDVIVTGTPGGVGFFMDPPQFLKPGDRVEVEISGVGRLENVVA